MHDGRAISARSAHEPVRGAGPRSRTRRVTAAVALVIALGGIGTLGGASAAQAQIAAGVVAEEGGDSVPFYVVQRSFDGQQEFLFEIAQRFLGDGNRFNEIFELNKGRPQPDGGAMTTPTSLLPGWILQLPADAKGTGVQFGPLPGASSVAPEAQPQPSSTPLASPSASPSPTRPPSPRVSTTPVPRPAAVSTGASSGTGIPVALVVLLVVIVLGAGAAGVYAWRRRRAARAAVLPPAPPTVDRSAAWTIDSALKILVVACADEAIRFPGLYLVTVDDASIHVLLSTPSAAVPSGWSASSDGRTWSASLRYLQAQRVPEVSNEEFSRLVTLGGTDEGRILLNFQHANGPVSIEGAPGAVDDVLEGWLSEFASNPWSGSPDVVRLNARESAGTETLDEFLGRIDGTGTGIAVLESPPSKAQGEAIRSLYARPGFRWIFLVKGAYPGASWTFAARDGVLTSGLVPDVRYSSFAARRQSGSAPVG